MLRVNEKKLLVVDGDYADVNGMMQPVVQCDGQRYLLLEQADVDLGDMEAAAPAIRLNVPLSAETETYWLYWTVTQNPPEEPDGTVRDFSECCDWDNADRVKPRYRDKLWLAEYNDNVYIVDDETLYRSDVSGMWIAQAKKFATGEYAWVEFEPRENVDVDWNERADWTCIDGINEEE